MAPGDECQREVEHGEVGVGALLPADQDAAEAVEPGMGPLLSRPYSVAKMGLEWSAVIDRDDLRSPNRTGRTSDQLSAHLRPDLGAAADGGAHGPAQGPSPVGGAGIVRDHPALSAMPDRGLHPPG